jgi:hypothetical protein
MKYVPLFGLFFATLSAQSFTYGVKAGASLQNNYFPGFTEGANGSGRTYYTSKSRHYMVGPTLTADLPWWRLGVEVDALYRHLNYDASGYYSGNGTTAYSWTSATANRVDLPVLLRWRAPRHFYVVGGPVVGVQFREAPHNHSWSRYPGGGTEYIVHDDTSAYTQPVQVGLGSTYGIGYDHERWRLHWKPEIRYTIWHQTTTERVGLTQKHEEFQFLLGIEFGRR